MKSLNLMLLIGLVVVLVTYVEFPIDLICFSWLFPKTNEKPKEKCENQCIRMISIVSP